METVIFQKVQDYLTDYVGELTTPGTPVFNATTRRWRVPVLCKTIKGILPVGEFVADEAGNFIAIPDKEQMLRVLEAQVARLPFLVFGEKEEVERKGLEVVVV